MQEKTHQSHKGLSLEEISPHEWPAQVGELTILLSWKPGYCAVVHKTNVQEDYAEVRLLDWPPDAPLVKVPLYNCVPTRKTPQDIVQMYVPSAQEFSQALTHERSFPDFDSPALSKARRSSTKTKKVPILTGPALVAALALLNPAQKEAMKKLFGKKKGD